MGFEIGSRIRNRRNEITGLSSAGKSQPAASAEQPEE